MSLFFFALLCSSGFSFLFFRSLSRAAHGEPQNKKKQKYPPELTFIVCDANRPGRPPVGDVNLFFEQRSRSPSKSEGGGGGESSEAEPPQTSAPSYLHETAEVEVMIADPLSRGKGIAKEAVLLCLWWASVGATTAAKGARGSDSSSSSPVLLPRLRLAKVKIGRKNAASLALFKSMGFAKTGGSDFFQEDHLGLELFVRGEEEEREEEEEKGGAEAPSPPPPPPVTPSLCPLLASVGEYAVVGEVEGSEDAAAAS